MSSIYQQSPSHHYYSGLVPLTLFDKQHYIMFRALAAILPLLASTNAYFILSHPVLETTRLDP